MPRSGKMALASRLSFPASIALAAGFVLVSSSSLPPVVASHFGPGGGADGFMPRDVYRIFMLAMTLGLPLLLRALSSLVRLLPTHLINLPNREYWLAPERQGETVAYMERQGAGFGMLAAVFLCFVHWLVVIANGEPTPRLPESALLAGSLLFLAVLAIRIAAFVRHFLRRP